MRSKKLFRSSGVRSGIQVTTPSRPAAPVRCVGRTCSSSVPLLLVLYRIPFRVGKESCPVWCEDSLSPSSEKRGSRLSPVKTKTCKAGEDFSKSGLKQLMWQPANANVFLSAFSGGEEATNANTFAFARYLCGQFKGKLLPVVDNAFQVFFSFLFFRGSD